MLDESVLRLRVWPTEADMTNVHQAVYLLYMELGRWDLALRMGLGQSVIGHIGRVYVELIGNPFAMFELVPDSEPNRCARGLSA